MPQLLDLKRELLHLKDKDRKYLSIDKLIQYCDIEQQATNETLSTEQRHMEQQRQMSIWREDIASNREGERTVNESAFHAIKSLILVAGGSAAALLAFMGSIWASAQGSVKALLANGIAYFGGCLVGASIIYGLTYLTLLFFYELNWQKRGVALRFIIISLVIACYASMILGVFECYKAIRL